jgi:uncharacterized protein YbcI
VTGSGDRLGRSTGGRLNAAVARAVVRNHNRYRGRGPTKAYAVYRDNVLVVILEDTLTTAERSLLARGNGESVLRTRDQLEQAMRPSMVSDVEELTGRKVVAAMSSSQLEPDVASELFVLDQPVAGEAEPLPA